MERIPTTGPSDTFESLSAARQFLLPVTTLPAGFETCDPRLAPFPNPHWYGYGYNAVLPTVYATAPVCFPSNADWMYQHQIMNPIFMNGAGHPYGLGYGCNYLFPPVMHYTNPNPSILLQTREIPKRSCKNYNNDICYQGTNCDFSHEADDKSIRDTNGKNVCIFYLLDKCNYGKGCFYLHDGSNLPDGWWNDKALVAEGKAFYDRTSLDPFHVASQIRNHLELFNAELLKNKESTIVPGFPRSRSGETSGEQPETLKRVIISEECRIATNAAGESPKSPHCSSGHVESLPVIDTQESSVKSLTSSSALDVDPTLNDAEQAILRAIGKTGPNSELECTPV